MDESGDDDRPGVARVEFSEDEERSLDRLASTLGLVGTLQIVLSGVAVVLALIGIAMTAGRAPPVALVIAVVGLVFVGVPVWQGMLLREAGELIGKVASSDEDDQEYLASAFRRLRVVFVLEAVAAVWELYKVLS